VRFGSRADLWLPRDSELLVKVGDPVKRRLQRCRLLAAAREIDANSRAKTSFLGRKSSTAGKRT